MPGTLETNVFQGLLSGLPRVVIWFSKARRALVVLERRVFIPVLGRIWKANSLNEFDGELLSRPWTHSGVKSF